MMQGRSKLLTWVEPQNDDAFVAAQGALAIMEPSRPVWPSIRSIAAFQPTVTSDSREPQSTWPRHRL